MTLPKARWRLNCWHKFEPKLQFESESPSLCHCAGTGDGRGQPQTLPRVSGEGTDLLLPPTLGGNGKDIPMSNPSFVVPSAGAAGVAFAALIPPVDPARCCEAQESPPDESVSRVDDAGAIPDSHPAANPSSHAACDGVARSAGTATSDGAGLGRAFCGVVTIANHGGWSPKNPSAVPPSVMDGMGMQVSAIFAMAYNQSEHSWQRGRWAVVTSRGTIVILTGIRAEERPLNPADFPPCVQDRLTYGQAEALALEANTPRHAGSIVPREWSIALRRADSMDLTRRCLRSVRPEYAIVDADAIQFKTFDRDEAVMFAIGRDRDCIIVRPEPTIGGAAGVKGGAN